jgi:O-antigen ligase
VMWMVPWVSAQQVDADADPKLSIENIEDRLNYWERAVEWTLASPAVGGGAFRFNDADLTFSGVRGVVYVATDGERRFDAGQAHNVYLHVAAETGLLGAVAFFAPWGWTCVVLARRRPTKEPSPGDLSTVELSGVREFAVSMLVLAGGVGLVSEGVFAPSLGIVTAVAAIGGARLWERAG